MTNKLGLDRNIIEYMLAPISLSGTVSRALFEISVRYIKQLCPMVDGVEENKRI